MHSLQQCSLSEQSRVLNIIYGQDGMLKKEYSYLRKIVDGPQVSLIRKDPEEKPTALVYVAQYVTDEGYSVFAEADNEYMDNFTLGNQVIKFHLPGTFGYNVRLVTKIDPKLISLRMLNSAEAYSNFSYDRTYPVLGVDGKVIDTTQLLVGVELIDVDSVVLYVDGSPDIKVGDISLVVTPVKREKTMVDFKDICLYNSKSHSNNSCSTNKNVLFSVTYDSTKGIVTLNMNCVFDLTAQRMLYEQLKSGWIITRSPCVV